MSSTVILKIIRPNKDVSFYDNAKFKEHVIENWILTNKLIVNQDISDDGLTSTIYLEFADTQSRVEFQEDPVINFYKTERAIYNEENGIRTEIQR
jgi:hypothetical protein